MQRIMLTNWKGDKKRKDIKNAKEKEKKSGKKSAECQ